MKRLFAVLLLSIASPAWVNAEHMRGKEFTIDTPLEDGLLMICEIVESRAGNLVDRRRLDNGTYSLSDELKKAREKPLTNLDVELVVSADSYDGQQVSAFARMWRDRCLLSSLAN